MAVSRRDFARLFAVGGSAALFADPVWARQNAAGRRRSRPAIGGTGEAFWKSVRAQFVMPRRPRRAERRQPLPRLAAGARSAEARKRQRRSRSVGAEPRAAERREGKPAQDARRVPARHARRDRHHPQHQRGQQHGLERPRSQGRRRGDRLSRQPPEQPDGVEREGEALRLHGDRRSRRRIRTRGWSTTSTPTRRRSRRGRRS